MIKYRHTVSQGTHSSYLPSYGQPSMSCVPRAASMIHSFTSLQQTCRTCLTWLSICHRYRVQDNIFESKHITSKVFKLYKLFLHVVEFHKYYLMTLHSNSSGFQYEWRELRNYKSKTGAKNLHMYLITLPNTADMSAWRSSHAPGAGGSTVCSPASTYWTRQLPSI